MDGSDQRRGSATTTPGASPSTKNDIDELVTLTRNLGDDITTDSRSARVTSLRPRCETLHRIRQLLIDSANPGHAKDAFRNANGFGALLEGLRLFSGFYDSSTITNEERIGFFELVKSILDVLSAALNDHRGNRKYFNQRVEGGGWYALEQALASTGICGARSDGSEDARSEEQLFGYLVSCALGDEAIQYVFRGVLRIQPSINGQHDRQEPGKEQERGAVPSGRDSGVLSLSVLRDHVKKHFSGKEVLRNPEIVPVIINFWLMLRGDAKAESPIVPLLLTVLLVLHEIMTVSTANKIALHRTSVLSTFIQILLSDSGATLYDMQLVLDFVNTLLEFGVNKLEDAHSLVRQATHSNAAAEVLLQALKTSRIPAFIQFDLSLHGYSSVEFNTLGRPFPPAAPNTGYTITTWLRVDAFDRNCHTTLFGAYNKTQTCFVLLYIEKNTRQLILQTSVKAANPSVRFKSLVFREDLWCHLAIVHHRSKGISSSRASLYLNGEFAEQVKCQYPQSSNAEFVRAFLGTPPDLAPRLGTGVVCSRWTAASFHLFQDALSDELVAVHQKLGPRYAGNFQDCLGSFQTYRASAELYLHNEVLHPGKEEASQIVSAIRMKASKLLHESQLLVSFSPSSIIDDDDDGSEYAGEVRLHAPLRKEANTNLQQHAQAEGNALVINGAVPSISHALNQPHGVGTLAGEPVYLVPQSLDDALWRVGGCVAVCLNMIRLSKDGKELIRAIKILFESLDLNWRNSEAMEGQNGFGALAAILRDKLGPSPIIYAPANKMLEVRSTVMDQHQDLAFDLLRIILSYTGFDESRPEDSVLINPLAYRVLVVDLDSWRKGTAATQKLYFSQFVCFAAVSKHRYFNSKRLTRMRIVRRFIEALKGDDFSEESLKAFLEAFVVLVKCNVSGEVLRSLALFITYAVQEGRMAGERGSRSAHAYSAARSRSATPPTGPSQPLNGRGQEDKLWRGITRPELGIRVLEVYVRLLCERDNSQNVRKLARTVTSKWILFLLAEEDSRIVVLSSKILARLIVVNGHNYLKKISDAQRSGALVVLKNRLKRWWHSAAVWLNCFAVLFGRDIALVDVEMHFTVSNLLKAFATDAESCVVHPEFLSIITAMLATGLKHDAHTEVKKSGSQLTPGRSESESSHLAVPSSFASHEHATDRVKAAELKVEAHPGENFSRQQTGLLLVVAQFLNEIFTRSSAFRDFAVHSNYVQELLLALYPAVTEADILDVEAELDTRRPISTAGAMNVQKSPSIVPTDRPTASQQENTTETTPSGDSPSERLLWLRSSSFVLVSSDRKKYSALAKLEPIVKVQVTGTIKPRLQNPLAESLSQAVIATFIDQIFHRKDFTGFGLFLKVPPGYQDNQAHFQSYFLLRALAEVQKQTQTNEKLLVETRVITNLTRYAVHMAEAIFEGWFLDGAEPLLKWLGALLEYLERPRVAQLKSVRLCKQQISVMKGIILRVALLHLSKLGETEDTVGRFKSITEMAFWKGLVSSSDNSHVRHLRLVSFLSYNLMDHSEAPLQMVVAHFLRNLPSQKPAESSSGSDQRNKDSQQLLSQTFPSLANLEGDALVKWVNEHQAELDEYFYGTFTRHWEEHVAQENLNTEETAKVRQNKRRDKLQQWRTDEKLEADIWHRHCMSTNHWRLNVHAAERLKQQRALQDQQDNLNFMMSSLGSFDRLLQGPCNLVDKESQTKWELDETEGRNRMRMRILPYTTLEPEVYQPKQKVADMASKNRLRLDTNIGTLARSETMALTPVPTESTDEPPRRARSFTQSSLKSGLTEEEFEIIDDPRQDIEDFEDKHRKVMRTLRHGDQVQHVFNVSRVVGLEACEGLLILGQEALYLLDDFFQKADGEIVWAWQAPNEERDPFLQLISGRETSRPKSRTKKSEQGSRHWSWKEVISFSKRRFLFRDVAIEIFFGDGRSYLLTAMSHQFREDLYAKLTDHAPHVNMKLPRAPDFEEGWRIEALRNPEEIPQTLGSKFVNVFSSASPNLATRKWVKGELSNFHYLMLVNTMAGRTFNDLTQYPVFPWVLADYMSSELDLTDQRSFRDLSKPMGCQTPSREAEFRDRYQSFAEMGDSPPFHYGTHYSSAMIVASYLIRLEPFVQSYLLLQGGNFDHADRLFHSIDKTWMSASRNNMTDVRELIPEFFYLPEFLTNINKYDFGARQATGEKIDDVTLPAWAKGDPQVFIAKHREALESPYVSKNLHRWIDLVFGFKQRGDAAIESTNVFHHLSYQGAKNLEDIADPVERAATIGIIHNFGQTPHQIFQRPHPPREEVVPKVRSVESAAETLSRASNPLLDIHERIATLSYSSKHERVFASPRYRLNMAPNYDRYMSWGFTDRSIRFHTREGHKLVGLFEHVHQSQVSCAIFADSTFLITSGSDCVVTAWRVMSSQKAIDLQLKGSLFGHLAPVTVLATSRASGTLLSASTDGLVLLWDLNRLEFVRELTRAKQAVQCALINNITGHIVLCVGQRVLVYTLNGRLILDDNVCDTIDENDFITACAFYEGIGNEWMARELLFTGHRAGVVNVWSITLGAASGKWHLEFLKRLSYADASAHQSAGSSSAITCILAVGQSVYTGNESGQVFEWECGLKPS